MKRWFMLNECVTEPVATRVMRRMLLACCDSSTRLPAGCTTIGALSMVGRSAGVPSALYRYGG